MEHEISLNRCLSFINCQLKPASGPVPHDGYHRRPAITLSRQSGAGAHVVAEHLCQILQAEAPDPPGVWTVFDRNLVEKVLDEHHLPTRMAKFMPEDRISEISDTMDELFGLHPPSWTLVHKSTDTILHLAELGNVIIIGRGAAAITSKMTNVFHVRLVAPIETRIAYVARVRGITPKAATTILRQEDLGRQRYMRKYFGRNVEDPLLYHLVINTGFVSYEQAARLIADQVKCMCPIASSAEMQLAG